METPAEAYVKGVSVIVLVVAFAEKEALSKALFSIVTG